MSNIVSVKFPDPGGLTLGDIDMFCEAFPDLSIVIDNGTEISFILREDRKQ